MKNRLGFRLSIPRRFWPVQKISTDMFRTRQGAENNLGGVAGNKADDRKNDQCHADENGDQHGRPF